MRFLQRRVPLLTGGARRLTLGHGRKMNRVVSEAARDASVAASHVQPHVLLGSTFMSKSVFQH